MEQVNSGMGGMGSNENLTSSSYMDKELVGLFHLISNIAGILFCSVN